MPFLEFKGSMANGLVLFPSEKMKRLWPEKSSTDNGSWRKVNWECVWRERKHAWRLQGIWKFSADLFAFTVTSKSIFCDILYIYIIIFITSSKCRSKVVTASQTLHDWSISLRPPSVTMSSNPSVKYRWKGYHEQQLVVKSWQILGGGFKPYIYIHVFTST